MTPRVVRLVAYLLDWEVYFLFDVEAVNRIATPYPPNPANAHSV